MKFNICVKRIFFLSVGLLLAMFSLAQSQISYSDKFTDPKSHSDIITSLSFSADEKILVSAGVDATMQFWDIAADATMRRMFTSAIAKPHMWVSLRAAKEKNLVPLVTPNVVKLFSVDESARLEQVIKIVEGAKVSAVSISNAGSVVALGYETGVVEVYDNSTGKMSSRFLKHRTGISVLAFSDDGNQLASGDDEGKIWLWDLVSGKEITTIVRNTAPIMYLEFYNEGKNLISGSQDNMCRLWELSAKKEVKNFPARIWNSHMLSLSPDEAVLAYINVGGVLQWMSMTDYKIITTMVPATSQFSAFTFSPKGTQFALATNSGLIKLFSVKGIESSPVKQVPSELLVLEPNISKDARGMKLAQITEDQLINVSGIFASMNTLDSVVVQDTLASITKASALDIAKFKLQQKNIYSFSSKIKLPVGEHTLSIAAYDSRKNILFDEIVVRVEKKKVESVAAKSERRAETHAFIVGISEYQEKSYNLKYASDDARFFLKVLKDPQAGGISSDRLTYLLDDQATTDNIISKLETTLKTAFVNDVVLIYFACHGFSEKGEIYYMAHDTNPNKLRQTGVRATDILNIVSEYGKDKKVILIYDACNSGGMGQQLATRGPVATEEINKFYEEISKEKNFMATLTSTEKGELAYEGEQYGGGHGAFTYYLGMGLNGAANSDMNQYITLGELYRFVRKKVSESTNDKQHPALNFNASAGGIVDIPIYIVK